MQASITIRGSCPRRPVSHGSSSCVAFMALLLIAAASTALAHDVRPLTAEPGISRLLDWIRSNGGEWAVEVATIDGVRGAVASHDIQPGENLLVLPTTITHLAKQAPDLVPAEAAAELMARIRDPQDWQAPFWASMPLRNEILGIFSFPPEYIETLQAPGLGEWLEEQQEAMLQYWKAHPELEAAGHRLEDLQYAADMLTTRSFANAEGYLMVPLLDMANHVNLCNNSHSRIPCPSNTSQQCEVWVAARSYRKGEEACLNYGGMFGDRSFLQYGWVMDSPRPQPLFGVDRHDFDYMEVWKHNTWEHAMPDPFTADTAQAYLDEAGRLRMTSFFMKQADEAMAGVPAAPSDPTGYILGEVKRWRSLRKEALQAEIGRLTQAAAALGGVVKSEEEYEQELQQVYQDEAAPEPGSHSGDDEDDPYDDDEEPQASRDEL